MSGIIQAARDKQRSRMPVMDRNRLDSQDKPNQDPKILDLSVLKDYVGKVLEHWKTKEENLEMNRKHTYVWEVELRHVLGKVNEPQWVFSIEAAIEWAVENYGSVQANGQWEVYKWEINQEAKVHSINKTVGKDNDGKAQTTNIKEQIEYLVVGIQFVDVKGEKNMMYEMGRPSTRKRSELDPEVLKALMANAPAKSGSDPKVSAIVEKQEEQIANQAAALDTQKEQLMAQQDMISEMKAKQDKTNDMMAALLTELKEQRATLDAKVSRRSRK